MAMPTTWSAKSVVESGTNPVRGESVPARGDSSAQPIPKVPDHGLVRVIGFGSRGEEWVARNVMGTPRSEAARPGRPSLNECLRIGLAGRRFESLEVLAKPVAIRPPVDSFTRRPIWGWSARACPGGVFFWLL